MNTVGACLYPILTTSNGGRQAPAASVYTDGRNASVGTSFSAPMVAGVASMVLAVHPRATPSEVAALLQSSAAPFPTTGADASVPQCTAPQFDAQNEPVDQTECYCTTGTCGAGMLDARAAVLAAKTAALAATGAQALITVTPANPKAGEPFTLDASASVLASGNTLAGVTWSLVDGGGIVNDLAATTPQTTLTASGSGTVRVQLSVVDSAGNTSMQPLSIFVGAGAVTAASADPAATSGGGGALSVGYLVALLAAVIAAFRARRARS